MFLYFPVFSFVAKDKPHTRFTVTGTPILLTLEDVDGAPTFLEKALRFVEEYGRFFLFLSGISFQQNRWILISELDDFRMHIPLALMLSVETP